MNEIEFVKKLGDAVNEYVITRTKDAAITVHENEIVIVMQVVSSFLAKESEKDSYRLAKQQGVKNA